jgi:hypothetical protein
MLKLLRLFFAGIVGGGGDFGDTSRMMSMRFAQEGCLL